MNADLEMVLRLLLATALGAVIGFQRERSGKEAGLRTNMLICLGSALFTVLSIYAFPGSDPARIAAGIATGIGFIGAGVILHRTGGVVLGLTSAATIWTVAAIGMAAGAGMYYIAPAATVLALIILLLPHLKKPTDKS
ncbi:MAG: magnesium transporter MgtC [Chloroflexi bacterium RBG_16_50_11]|nr:MAG: magnesium transporter MgtC [Chloroflexi bacterium RBG_16_50_11]